MSASVIGRPTHAPPDSAVPDLVTRFDGLAVALARRFSAGRRLDDDLLQVARLGLVLAARRYEPARGDFAPYAAATMRGELKRHLRDHGWSVRVPRRVQEDALAVSAATERLRAAGVSEPTLAELAVETGLSDRRVREAAEARQARYGVELDPASVGEGVADDPNDDLAILRVAVGELADDDRELLTLRFGAELTQGEIGERIGVSQPQVHRRIKVALADLERRLEVAA